MRSLMTKIQGRGCKEDFQPNPSLLQNGQVSRQCACRCWAARWRRVDSWLACTLGAPALGTLPQQLHNRLLRNPALVRAHPDSTEPV